MLTNHDQVWVVFFVSMAALEVAIVTITAFLWSRRDSEKRGLLVIMNGLLYTSVVLLTMILMVL